MPNPARPIGRQYAGSVPTPYGSVDYSHFDPAFFTGAEPMPLDSNDALGAARITAVHLFGTNTASISANYQKIAADIQALGWASALDKWEAMAKSGGELNDEQDIVGLQAQVAALEASSNHPAPAHTHALSGSTGPAE